MKKKLFILSILVCQLASIPQPSAEAIYEAIFRKYVITESNDGETTYTFRGKKYTSLDSLREECEQMFGINDFVQLEHGNYVRADSTIMQRGKIASTEEFIGYMILEDSLKDTKLFPIFDDLVFISDFQFRDHYLGKLAEIKDPLTSDQRVIMGYAFAESLVKEPYIYSDGRERVLKAFNDLITPSEIIDYSFCDNKVTVELPPEKEKPSLFLVATKYITRNELYMVWSLLDEMESKSNSQWEREAPSEKALEVGLHFLDGLTRDGLIIEVPDKELEQNLNTIFISRLMADRTPVVFNRLINAYKKIEHGTKLASALEKVIVDSVGLQGAVRAISQYELAFKIMQEENKTDMAKQYNDLLQKEKDGLPMAVEKVVRALEVVRSTENKERLILQLPSAKSEARAALPQLEKMLEDDSTTPSLKRLIEKVKSEISTS